jgi:hypothetical protein
VPTIDRATSAWRSSRRVRQHSIRCTTAHHCCLVGRAQLSHIDDRGLARGALPTIDVTSRARWRRLRMLQGCRRCTSTSCCCVTRRALMLDNVDPLRRGRSVDHRCRRPCMVAPLPCAPTLPSMCHYSLLSYGGTSADVGQCRLVEARCAVSTHRPRCPCTVAPPSCAPRLPMMYQCSLWWNGGPRADFGQCRLVEARGEVWTIDLAARVRWHGSCVRQRCLRCTSTRCRHSAGRVQMSDNVDSSRRAVQCRPSTSPPVRGGAAVVCAKVAHYVPVLTVIVWWDARRCWSMPTRRGARRSVD